MNCKNYIFLVLFGMLGYAHTNEVCSEIPNCEYCPEVQPFGVICEKCADGHLMLHQQFGSKPKCAVSCPEGYQKNGEHCVEEGCSDFYCTKCKVGWIKGYQMDKKCLKHCPDGFYEDFDLALDGNVCRRCRRNCKQCSKSWSCDVCSNGYSTLMKRAFSRCVKRCPNTYVTMSTDKGQVCQKETRGCMDERCTTCQNGWYYLKSWRNSQCVQQCPVGYFEENRGDQLMCRQCIYNCAQCSQLMSCSRCFPGFSLSEDNSRSYCMRE